MGIAAVGESACKIGIQPYCLCEAGDGARVILLVVENQPAIVVGRRKTRIELDGLVEISQGAVRRAAITPDGAAVVIALGVLRVGVNGPVEVGKGPFAVALFGIGQAAPVQRLHMRAVELQRLAVILYGGVQLFLPTLGIPARDVKADKLCLGRAGFADERRASLDPLVEANRGLAKAALLVGSILSARRKG